MNEIRKLEHGPEDSFLRQFTDFPSLFNKTQWQELVNRHGRGLPRDDIATAQEVAHLVRGAVDYGKVDCRGYAILASEGLEHLEIPHDIGVVGNHTFLLVHDGQDRFLLDFPSDWMDGEAGEYIIDRDDGGLLLDAGSLISSKDYETQVKCQNNLERITNYRELGANRHKLPLEILPSAWGREVIKHRFNREWGIIKGYAGKAAMSMAWLKMIDLDQDKLQSIG